MQVRVIEPGTETVGEVAQAMRDLAGTAATAAAEAEAMLGGTLQGGWASRTGAMRRYDAACGALVDEVIAADGMLAAMAQGWRP